MPPRRMGVQDGPSPDRPARRWIPQDVAVAAYRHDRRRETELHQPRGARSEFLRVKEPHVRPRSRSADVELDQGIVPQWCFKVVEHLQAGVDQKGGAQRARAHDDLAPGNLLGRRPAEVHGHPVTRVHDLHLRPVRLQTAHSGRDVARQDGHVVADGEGSVAQRPGDDCAEPGHGEHAVDGQAGPSDILAGRGCGYEAV